MAARLLLLLLAMSLLAGSGTAHAAVLCGRVTDAATAAPVSAAGVFVRDTLGAYLGLATATDGDGRFCFPDIAPGTYDLEIRRDAYATRYRRVTVTEATTDVDVPLGVEALAFAPPFPNPGRGAVTLLWSQRDAGPMRLRIVDAAGRTVREYRGQFGAGSHRVRWDGRDHLGTAVPPGRFLAVLESDSEIHVRPIVRIARP